MLKNNLVRISIIFAAIAALAVGMAIPVSAASTTPATTPALTTVQGIVNSVTPGSSTATGSFAVQSGSTSVNVATDSNTKYYLIPVGKAQSFVNNAVNQDKNAQSRAAKLRNLHIPANWRDNLGFLDTFGQAGTFSSIAVDDRVIARVNSNEVAAQVLIIKAPVVRQIRGTVTISGNNITINALNGTTVNLTWATTTEFIVKGYSLPSSGYAVVTYNSTTNVASLVNFAAKEPTPSTTTTTPSTTTPTTTTTTTSS
jgi:hypothetical protein